MAEVIGRSQALTIAAPRPAQHRRLQCLEGSSVLAFRDYCSSRVSILLCGAPLPPFETQMRRCFPLVFRLSLALTSAASSAGAQVPAAGDRDPAGRVLAKIVAKMPEPGPSGYPVHGLSLFVVTETGERIAVRTDAAGVANTWLRPGTYRFVTRAPIEWSGKA